MSHQTVKHPMIEMLLFWWIKYCWIKSRHINDESPGIVPQWPHQIPDLPSTLNSHLKNSQWQKNILLGEFRIGGRKCTWMICEYVRFNPTHPNKGEWLSSWSWKTMTLPVILNKHCALHHCPFIPMPPLPTRFKQRNTGSMTALTVTPASWSWWH